MIATQQAQKVQGRNLLLAKLKDYSILVKLRLNLTVVFSAVIGYLLAVGATFQFIDLFLLGLSGFLVTGSANAINQVLEKDYDKLMKRTANRPLASNRMQSSEALLLAGLMGISGTLMLWYFFNSMAALLGAVSLLSYAFIYTPVKRISPIAVFIGAFPGALPPVIGWTAATAMFGYEAYILFSIQFLWQFPHFWAIGWLGYDEYKKAGYKLLPTSYDGRNTLTTIQINVYIFALIAVSALPFYVGLVSQYSVIVALIFGGMFFYYGVCLYKEQNNKAALKLMFASIIYLPFVQAFMVFDRLFF